MLIFSLLDQTLKSSDFDLFTVYMRLGASRTIFFLAKECPCGTQSIDTYVYKLVSIRTDEVLLRALRRLMNSSSLSGYKITAYLPEHTPITVTCNKKLKCIEVP